MAVNISGSVLASLLYDHAQSKGHQMGFLIGQVVSHMTDTISDSQINNYEVETKVCIYGSVACPKDQRFYNEKGEILVDMLPDRGKNIVGWYSFRRCSSMRPSIMERIVHENLMKFLKQYKNHFMFLLCSSHVSKNKSTHSFDHSFSCLGNSIYGADFSKSFQRKPVTIINLGDTTHQEYRNLPSQTAASNQGIYSLVVEQQEDNFLDARGNMEVRQIQSLNGALKRKLEELASKVEKSETRLSTLEEEVQTYRKQVKLKMLEKQQKQSTVPVKDNSVPKKPSVDDILFMDTSDGLQEPGLHPENTPKIEVTEVKTETQSSAKGNHSKSSVKSEIKLTSPVSLHSRSNSMSNDKSFNEDSINATDIIHARSKSADLPETDLKESKKVINEKDPFSFVSNVMAQSKNGDEHKKSGKVGKSDKSVPSNSVAMETKFSERTTRTQSKQAEAASEAAKGIKLSTRRNMKNDKSNLNSVAKETDCETNGMSDMDADSDSSANVKTNLIGSTCSQEAGKTSEISLSEDSSQDTYDMEISSSPVY